MLLGIPLFYSPGMAQSSCFQTQPWRNYSFHTNENPTRKRRKTHHNVADLSHSPSPTPSSRAWDTASVDRRTMSQSQPQRRPTSERCHTPRNRRSRGVQHGGSLAAATPSRMGHIYQEPIANQRRSLAWTAPAMLSVNALKVDRGKPTYKHAQDFPAVQYPAGADAGDQPTLKIRVPVAELEMSGDSEPCSCKNSLECNCPKPLDKLKIQNQKSWETFSQSTSAKSRLLAGSGPSREGSKSALQLSKIGEHRVRLASAKNQKSLTKTTEVPGELKNIRLLATGLSLLRLDNSINYHLKQSNDPTICKDCAESYCCGAHDVEGDTMYSKTVPENRSSPKQLDSLRRKILPRHTLEALKSSDRKFKICVPTPPVSAWELNQSGIFSFGSSANVAESSEAQPSIPKAHRHRKPTRRGERSYYSLGVSSKALNPRAPRSASSRRSLSKDSFIQYVDSPETSIQKITPASSTTLRSDFDSPINTAIMQSKDLYSLWDEVGGEFDLNNSNFNNNNNSPDIEDDYTRCCLCEVALLDGDICYVVNDLSSASNDKSVFLDEQTGDCDKICNEPKLIGKQWEGLDSYASSSDEDNATESTNCLHCRNESSDSIMDEQYLQWFGEQGNGQECCHDYSYSCAKVGNVPSNDTSPRRTVEYDAKLSKENCVEVNHGSPVRIDGRPKRHQDSSSPNLHAPIPVRPGRGIAKSNTGVEFGEQSGNQNGRFIQSGVKHCSDGHKYQNSSSFSNVNNLAENSLGEQSSNQNGRCIQSDVKHYSDCHKYQNSSSLSNVNNLAENSLGEQSGYQNGRCIQSGVQHCSDGHKYQNSSSLSNVNNLAENSLTTRRAFDNSSVTSHRSNASEDRRNIDASGEHVFPRSESDHQPQTHGDDGVNDNTFSAALNRLNSMKRQDTQIPNTSLNRSTPITTSVSQEQPSPQQVPAGSTHSTPHAPFDSPSGFNMPVLDFHLPPFFQQLVSQYYFESFLWVYQNILFDPLYSDSQNMIAQLGLWHAQTSENIVLSLLTGHMTATIEIQRTFIQQSLTVVCQVAATGSVNAILAEQLRHQAIDIGISLNPKHTLRNFAMTIREVFKHIQRERQVAGPTTRRRVRDRNTIRQSESPERRAFQPPTMTQPQPAMPQQQIHPAVLPHQAPHHHPFIIDMTQVPVSAPVTMAPYAIPVCTAGHHIPTAAHMPQPTWTFPGCTVQFPACSIQHIPACGLPMTQHLQQHMQPVHVPPHLQHHHPNPIHTTHFVPTTQHIHGHHQHHPEGDLHMMGDRRQGSYHIPSAIHRGPAMNPAAPVLLQEPAVHPQPHDLYGPYSRFVRRQPNRTNRWRSVPPPPPYPGLLLHFLAMLGNPPVHGAYRMELGEEAAGVENYEALLHLAERLGEAKSRGLTKAEIELLPSYRFTADNRDPTGDQTSCVVCMCDFEPRQLLRVLPCAHEFHGKCVDKWLKTNRTCPICRADASETASSQSE